MKNLPKFLTENQTAAYLNLGRATLTNWRNRHKGPPYVRLPTGGIRYPAADLEAWIASGKVIPGGNGINTIKKGRKI